MKLDAASPPGENASAVGAYQGHYRRGEAIMRDSDAADSARPFVTLWRTTCSHLRTEDEHPSADLPERIPGACTRFFLERNYQLQRPPADLLCRVIAGLLGSEDRPPIPCPPPLAYGYLRLDLVPADDLRSSELRLIMAAKMLGCELAAIFREPTPQTTVPPAYLELVRECCRAEARIVITGRDHLSNLELPRTSLLAVLAGRAHVRVHEISL
ncbi:hypothetical protein [Nocardia africana]|uniref:Uncharacterized protein n=1 Tax=Nocardia africana TaxID=134964 RepID=A0ABW6NKY5_9NOCA